MDRAGTRKHTAPERAAPEHTASDRTVAGTPRGVPATYAQRSVERFVAPRAVISP
ncbi:hypothetical protein SAMN05216505_111100 [Streptomyces prasinopilosus]|uniref:Uncharacterized protein n=1 Tax=Streptomyces prasinopilosus TaxID=67344 RepID=A0A1G6X7T4_9ACTN|nr:hypothetical protein SAMN05216505_111100 [Streptomyces prasinopilosus]